MLHLKKTYEVVGDLKNNDVKVMKMLHIKRQEEKERERE